MASTHKTLIFFTFFISLLSFSRAYTFAVGGRDGWTLHPSENYNQWSGRLRFIVNDALHFKYNGGSDSVLEVNNGDYQNCTTKNPITTLAGGDSFFTLDRPGPFYFISGNKTNCDQGQKLSLVVISPKTKPATPPATAASPPGSSTPPGSASPPGSSSPPRSASPPGSSSTPGSASPPGSSSSPVQSPEYPISSPPQPGSTVPASPTSSPGGSGSSSPAGSPMTSPAGSPMYSPAGSPTGSGSMSPAGSPAGGPMGSNPADVNAPPPASSSEKVGASAVLILPLVMILFGCGFLH